MGDADRWVACAYRPTVALWGLEPWSLVSVGLLRRSLSKVAATLEGAASRSVCLSSWT